MTYRSNIVDNMKRTLFLISLAFSSLSMCSQTITKELMKERKEIAKMTKAEVSEKATKAARKEAKRLEKEGWRTAPGALPLEKQLDRVYQMQYEIDEESFPKYIMGEAMSIGSNYDAAKMQAMELAKQNLAGQIQTEVAALVENTVENKQLNEDESVSVTKSVMNAKNLILQSLGRVLTVMEVYRENGKKKEVRVQIAYSSKQALQATRKAIVQDLENQGEDLRQKLDDIWGK